MNKKLEAIRIRFVLHEIFWNMDTEKYVEGMNNV